VTDLYPHMPPVRWTNRTTRVVLEYSSTRGSSIPNLTPPGQYLDDLSSTRSARQSALSVSVVQRWVMTVTV